MGIRDKPTAPASPNGFAERLIGSIRLPGEAARAACIPLNAQ
jgi:hypothetical protein